MAAQRNKIDRSKVRAQVIPQELRGLATLKEEEGHRPFLVWDVSETGLGLWLAEPINVGESIVLAVGQPFMSVLVGKVVWCEPMSSEKGYRCGVEVTSDLEILSRLAGSFIPGSG